MRIDVGRARFGTLLAVLALLGGGCGGSGGDGPAGDGAGPFIDLGVFPAANVVIGQVDFAGKNANQGGAVSAHGMNTPTLSPAMGSLYVCDYANSRILGYATVPTVNNADADFVIGQLDFVSSAGGVGPSQLDHPWGVNSDGVRLAVADTLNHRVLLWLALPTSNVAASLVLGQMDFVSNAAGTSATTMSFPRDVQLVGGRLFVADGGNNRVLIWNTLPTTNGQPADIVVGQPDFTSNGTGTTATSLAGVRGLWSDGVRLAVADEQNHRVLIWNSIPTTNGAPADVVLGQPDFTTALPALGAQGMNEPLDVNSNGTQLFIADNENSRVLIHNVMPTTNYRAADAVLGQSDFLHGQYNDDDQDGASDATASARTMWYPSGVLPMGDQLIVVDGDNSRVLIFGP